LQGRRIVVTRADGQNHSLIAGLSALGVDAIALPTIRIAPATEPLHLIYALQAWRDFDLCIFASANAVHSVARHARAAAIDLVRGRPFICAQGPATAAAWEQECGCRPELVPTTFNAEGMLAALAATPMRDCKVFVPGAEGGRDELARGLMRRGAIVTRVPAYRTELAAGSEGLARALFPGADAAIFTSPSTARHLALLLGPDYRQRLQRTALAVIGPVTRREVERLGLQVAVEARQATEPSLIAALSAYFNARIA